MGILSDPISISITYSDCVAIFSLYFPIALHSFTWFSQDAEAGEGIVAGGSTVTLPWGGGASADVGFIVSVPAEVRCIGPLKIRCRDPL